MMEPVTYRVEPEWVEISPAAQEDTSAPTTVSAESATVIDLRSERVIDLRELEQEPRVFIKDGQGLLGAPAHKLFMKRIMDVITSAVLIVLLLPVMLVAALAVALTSRGSLLFVQDRVGKSGRVFRFAKFRSMYNGAHERRDDLQSLNEADGPVFKIREDPRITPVGRFMRKMSIDELPQLFHVLTGEMSLVGPRPPIPSEVEQYSAWERQRLLAKPGLTCIWQVSGRSDLDFETWVGMDIDYIANWRPWLDFSILLKTVPAILSGRGAY